jgi:hypothetical protein
MHIYNYIQTTNKTKIKVMKKTTTFITNENKDCFVDYGFGLGKQPAVIFKDIEYEITNLKSVNGIESFELWDEEGFIGEYSFSKDMTN